jgi:uncharacterized RDD family membrane protein YckC
VEYAGFRRRGVALLIDLVVVGFAWFAVFFLSAIAFGLAIGFTGASEATSDRLFDKLFGPVLLGITILVPIAYSTLCEGVGGATFGKVYMGLRVTAGDGRPIGLRTGLVRAVGKAVSTALGGIGFLPAALSERRQALHDSIAGTVVVRRRESPVPGAPDVVSEQADLPVMIREG